MVKIGQPNECDCKSCPGSYPLKMNDDMLTAGRQLYGGFLCICSCHDAQRAKDKAERDARDMCSFCHTNSDHQTRCCAKLALVYDELVVLRNYYGKHGLESHKLDIDHILEGLGKC